MKANELRIGNLINYEQTTHKVASLQEEYCSSTWVEDDDLYIPYMHSYDYIKPIPLTEDWLIKFGFKKRGLKYSKKFVFVAKYNYENHITFEGWRYKPVDLLFVHQLQNLYFALTNEELTIK